MSIKKLETDPDEKKYFNEENYKVTDINSTNNTTSRKVFYQELFDKFDNLIIGIKKTISQNIEENIMREKNKLVKCKEDLQKGLEILLSLESFESSLSLVKRKELLVELQNRSKKFEEVKELVNLHHEKLRNYFINEVDSTEKRVYLEDLDNDNDLTEHLLLVETKRNIEKACQNLSEINSELQMQGSKLSNIDKNINSGKSSIGKSNRNISGVTNIKFYTKLTLYLVSFFLFIAICLEIFLILYNKFTSKPDNQNN